MERARRAGSTALIVVVIVATIGGWGGPALAAVVAWPPSTLVISEIQTGGASASDEFVEVANQGSAPVDLVGLEVVYATSSGSTVTRKATWAGSTPLDPGRRILLANAAGVHAALADATYSGGFAATGGAVVLRIVGGAVIDAIGWGDATSAFVEGTPAPAPPAGSSLERAPGGPSGNGTDTNDNAVDWFVQGAPSPQGLGAPPVPTPVASTSPSATPTAAPTPTSTPRSTPTPAPTPTMDPTPTATPEPTPTSTPAPTPSPTTSTPAPTVTSIAEARSLADGTAVTINGVLTTALGALESGRSGFVQDATGGIALYLDAAVVANLPSGTTVTVEGSLVSRYGQRTLRIAEAAVVAGIVVDLPTAPTIPTGEASEPNEGTRIRVAGTVTESPDTLADGLGITVDDGSGAVRVVVGPDALEGRTVEVGMTATVVGPLGQRDSSGTGVTGYRIHATLLGELELETPAPTPSPTTTPSPSPIPSPAASSIPTQTPVPSHSAQPTPTASPTPSPTPPASSPAVTLADVRALPIGSRVTARGVVVAEAGRLGTAPLLAIGDATGGLVVRLPAGSGSYRRGVTIEVTGKLAAPYGQLEIRPTRADIVVRGSIAMPAPYAIGTAPLEEGLEGRLVTTTGRLAKKPTRTAAGDITMLIERDGGAAVKVTADASSRVSVGSLKVGATYRIVGVVGQRASRSGALDGYRIWVRDAADLAVIGAPGSSPVPSPSASASASSPAVAIVTIARAVRITDRSVAIGAIVTAPGILLDSTGRRIVVQDATGAIEILLPTGTAAPPVGTRIRAEGRIGVAYGAPRLRGDAITVIGRGTPPAPVVLRGAPGATHEWELVTITGRVTDVRKLADRWRAELRVGSHAVVVIGQPGAGVASTVLVEGQPATVTGIVRRPYPNATDRRFAVTPRFPADVVVAGREASAAQSAASGSGEPGTTSTTASADPSSSAVVDADVIDLDAFAGRIVRIGGLVVDLGPDGFTIDDGTAIGRVVLRDAALELLGLVEPDDALNAIGMVEASAVGPVVVVTDPGAVVRAGDPVAADPASSPDASTVNEPTPGAEATGAAGGRLAGLAGGGLPLEPGAAGFGTLVAISVVSLVVSLLRRRYRRRLLTARVTARLASLAGPTAGSMDSTPAERGPSTIHSA